METRRWALELLIDVRLIVTSVDASAKLRKTSSSFVISVCPSAWNSSAPSGRILMKFDI
jgi:hypothetical protein